MPTHEHNELLKDIAILSQAGDEGNQSASDVIKNDLRFLLDNTQHRELIFHASTTPWRLYIYSMAVPNDVLNKNNDDDFIEDLMRWRVISPISAASYDYEMRGEKKNIILTTDNSIEGSEILSKGEALIYIRSLDDVKSGETPYFELSQKFSHSHELHHFPEYHGYCGLDDNNDVVPIVSVTRKGPKSKTALVTFEWKYLNQYLVASKQVLIRMFHFTFTGQGTFSGWGEDGREEFVKVSDSLFYRQLISKENGYARGVQIIRPSGDKERILHEIALKRGWEWEESDVEFTARDLRDGEVKKISTHPEKTANYHNAGKNDLPHEMSPAFFNPEVLSRYIADKEKYAVSEDTIGCRNSWLLEVFRTNDAGQVFTYIRYLRCLPEAELSHWKMHNEDPRAPISERAEAIDFRGEFHDQLPPLENVKNLLKEWHEKGCNWWNLGDRDLLANVTELRVPSRDAWQNAFNDLFLLVIEGFCIENIQQKLDDQKIKYDDEERSLALLKKLIQSKVSGLDKSFRLRGLQAVRVIRNTKGHRANASAEKLASEAREQHGSLPAHFSSVCKDVLKELKLIEDAMG